MAERLPLRAQRREARLHRQRHGRGALARFGHRERIVEKDQDAVAGEAIDRPSCALAIAPIVA